MSTSVTASFERHIASAHTGHGTSRAVFTNGCRVIPAEVQGGEVVMLDDPSRARISGRPCCSHQAIGESHMRPDPGHIIAE